jgi:hypothetical protein
VAYASIGCLAPLSHPHQHESHECLHHQPASPTLRPADDVVEDRDAKRDGGPGEVTGKVAPTMVLLVEGSLIQRFGEATSAITPANVKSGPVTIGTTA